ncbi:MAG: carbohydrate ABC transporter permease, partial [bacterium]
MMVQDRTLGSRVFDTVNLVVLSLVGLSCLLPVIHLAAVSFSDASAVGGGLVSLWPVRPTLASYEQLVQDTAFFRASGVSILRTSVGTVVNMALTMIVAYPMAQSPRKLKYRNPIMSFVIITMYFNAGLIPTYMVVRAVG